MICSACGQENREGAKFCVECGEQSAKVCASCGTELVAGAKFCDECGTPTAVVPKAASAVERTPRDYTPKHLAEKILRQKSALEGERKQVTVLFADVKGSMDLAEQVGAETWHGILDRFFQILSEGVHRFEGTVNQYTGDGIMALFGAPVAHEDHAQRACYAALRLRDELRSYADELRRTLGLSFSVRIGLNSGEVVVGRIGDDLRMDYTAQGLTVGLAQRMEQLAAADSTYLTENTEKLAHGFFALRDLGGFTLKGVSEPVQVYELEGTGTLRTRLDRSRERGFSRFVGRHDELALLDAALERATSGQGGVVGVVADAGVGKSRLCLQFVERCREKNIDVFQAHCPAHGKLIPLLPIYELLRDFFGIAENNSPQATREKIAGRMLLLDRELEAELPLVFDFLGVPDPSRPLEETDPKQRQRALERMLRRLIQARSAREPAVMMIDDAHWIDSSSDEYLASLADTITRTRTLLLLNFRPEYSAPWMADSGYQQLPLLPLGEEAINDLLSYLLGDDPSMAPLRPIVRERSAGNPFFIEEIVYSLVEEGRLVGERGAYRLEGGSEQLRVPDSVHAILAARIDRLAPRAKGLLQTAGAIGRRFGDGLLRRVSELSAADYEEAIEALRRAEMIHEEALYPEIEYAFRHPLVHEVAQTSQLSDTRRAVHARIAAAIEEEVSDRPDENAALLAHHWDEADEPDPAARWHRRAAEHIAGSNSRAALGHWERVRALAGRVADEALALELGEQSRLMILEYGWRLGISPDEANALLEEGETWARANDDMRALAALYNAFAIPCAFSLGEIERARDLSLEGLRLAEQVGDEPLAFALELRVYFTTEPLGNVPATRRAMEASARHSPEVMDAAETMVGYDTRVAAVGFQGWAKLYDGTLLEALEDVRRGIAIGRERGATEVVGWLISVEAAVLGALGESALAPARESWEIAEQIDSDISRVVAAQYLSSVLLDEGDVGAAIGILEQVLPLAAGSAKHAEPELLSIYANALSAAGELSAARDAASRALDLAQKRGLRRCELSARMALAGVALSDAASTDFRALSAELERVRATAEDLGQGLLLPKICELRARLAERSGDAEGRVAALREAQQHCERMGATKAAERIALRLRT